MSERTPGPWEAGKATHSFFSNEQGLFDNGDVQIFPPLGEAGPVAIVAGEANAAFIVRACNAHDDLVKALDNLLGGMRGYLRARDLLGDEAAFPEFKQADAALAKAKQP